MSYEIATVAPALEATLKEALPGWSVSNIDLGPRTNTLNIGLTYEQLDVSSEFAGQRLAAGWLAVTFNLVLSAPEQDPAKATARVFANLPDLIDVLDALDDLVWTTASKARDAAGTFYTVPMTVFARTNTPDELE